MTKVFIKKLFSSIPNGAANIGTTKSLDEAKKIAKDCGKAKAYIINMAGLYEVYC